MPDVVPDILTPLTPAPPAPLVPPPVGFWQKFKASFGDSETILWSRLQVVFGVLGAIAFPIWVGLSSTDLSPVIKNPQWITYWLIANGVITEVLRRNRRFP